MTQNRVAAAIFILAVLLLLFGRLPSLSNDFCDPDLAGISYGARDLLAGGTIYDNCIETKPPGAYLIFATSFALFGRTLSPIYALAMLLHLAALLLLARLARRQAGPMAAAFTALFYAVLAIDTAAAAGCPNYDTWMIIFVAFAVAACPVHDDRPAARRFALTGVLIGVAFLMKQQAALFGLVLAVWIAAAPHGDRRAHLRSFGMFVLGGLAPLLAIIAGWAMLGSLGTMLTDLHPARLGGYVGAGADGQALAAAWLRGQEHLAGAWPLWLAVAAGGALWLRNARWRDDFARHLLLLVAAVGAVAAGSRFFNHYLIILAAPLALAAGSGVGLVDRLLGERRWRFAAYGALALATLLASGTELTQSAMSVRAWSRGDGPITGEMLVRFTRDDINLAERVDDRGIYRNLGAYIGSVTGEGETIYVWPYVPQVYFWADRFAPTKHYMYFDVAAALPYKHGGWHAAASARVLTERRRLLRDLQTDRPRFVVLTRDPDSWDHAFTDLAQWVAENYVPDPKAPGEGLRVFRLP